VGDGIGAEFDCCDESAIHILETCFRW